MHVRLRYSFREKKKYNYAVVKNRAWLDRLPRTLLFNIIFLTLCNLFFGRQHILQQPVFELQIQVKQDSLLQTIWLVGLYSCCTLTGCHTLTFYCNVHSVQIWAESESQRKQPTVLSCSILWGNLSLCLFFSSNHHNLSLDVICCFRDSAGSGFRHVLHTGETWVSVLLLLLPQARFVSIAKPSISLGGKSSLSKRETSPHSSEHTADLFLIGSGWYPRITFSSSSKKVCKQTQLR